MDEATLNMIKAINEKRQAEGKSELIITGQDGASGQNSDDKSKDKSSAQSSGANVDKSSIQAVAIGHFDACIKGTKSLLSSLGQMAR